MYDFSKDAVLMVLASDLYKEEDYIFLENEYQDWITRYECNTKAQESIFERLSFKKWEAL